MSQDLRKQSDMGYWFPLLKETDVPVPYTEKVPVHSETLDEGTINELTVTAADTTDVRDAVLDVGGPSAFLRTSQASDKHGLQSASKIDYLNESHIRSTIYSLATSMKMKMGVPEPTAYYVREWLELSHEFTAFEGLPISQELRVFINDGEITSTGFYWPHDAIRHPSAEDWEQLLTQTKEAALDDVDYVHQLTERVAEQFDDGYWSVDFAKTTAGEWYCIDMARGELSWHPEACEKPDGVGDD